jgi:predicted ArsR family transcriptional regulator
MFDTQIAALKAVKPKLIEQVAAFFKAGNAATADEVATALGETPLAIRPRVSELSKRGKLEPTGLRRKNSSGRDAVVWRAA